MKQFAISDVFRTPTARPGHNLQQGDVRDRGDTGGELHHGAVQAAAPHNLVHKRPKGEQFLLFKTVAT